MYASDDTQMAIPGTERKENRAADDRLRLLIERVERLEAEKSDLGSDIKDVYGEAKAVGYCPKTMRKVVAIRKLKPDDRREAEMILDTYKIALGID